MNYSEQIAQIEYNDTLHSVIVMKEDDRILYYEYARRNERGDWVDDLQFSDLRDAVRYLDSQTGYNASHVGDKFVGIVKVDTLGRVWRDSGHWSHLSGTPDFHKAWTQSHTSSLYDGARIVRDGGAAYKQAIVGLGLFGIGE